MAQAARIDTVNRELTDFRAEISGSISALEDKIDTTRAKIDAIKEEAGATRSRLSSLEEEIEGVTSQAEALEQRSTEATASLSRYMIDASEVYQKVERVTVTIGDGQNSVGSGFILDDNAHVLTAHHVMENLPQIYVVMYDGSVSKATSLGHCALSDIAVLKLDKKPDIEPLPLADSSRIKIGEPVIAIGNPFDLRDTLTSGIVIQINRFTEIQYNTQSRWVSNLIQFDAAANFGNSGGPLANAHGEIIGVIIARINPNEGDGIYYAVTANKIKRVADAIIASGSFDYPWVGVTITNLTTQVAQNRTLDTANGILVTAITIQSPARAQPESRSTTS